MKRKKSKSPYVDPAGKHVDFEIRLAKLNAISDIFCRSFKAGDIVALKDSKNVPFILKSGEYKAVETDEEILNVDDLVLICPVENRVDRKEAAK